MKHFETKKDKGTPSSVPAALVVESNPPCPASLCSLDFLVSIRFLVPRQYDCAVQGPDYKSALKESFHCLSLSLPNSTLFAHTF